MKKVYLINIICILLVFAVMIGFMTFLPKTDFTKYENRPTEKFPQFSVKAYFSGEFTSGITRWYTDTIPYRDIFESIVTKIKSLYGIATENYGIDLRPGANDSRPDSEEEFSFEDFNG